MMKPSRNSTFQSSQDEQPIPSQIKQADVQDIIQQRHQQENQQDEDDINYEDVFEEARREEVLRNLNLEQNNSEVEEKHEDLEEILDKKAKRQERHQQKQKNEEMKKLRQQNALEFFRKIKIEALTSFRDSILDAKQAENYKEDKVHKLLSCLNLQTLKFYQSLKAKHQNLRKRQQFYDLLNKIFRNNSIQLEGYKKYEAIWALALSLHMGFRKVSFIDISQMQLESFYNLKYEEIKGKKKKINKQLDILRNKLQRRATEQQLSNTNFVTIQSYSFNSNALNRTQNSIDSQNNSESSCTNANLGVQSFTSKSQKLRKIKKAFKSSYCQIYCPIQDNWELYNMQVLEPQEMKQTKFLILNGKAIIGFYSTRVMEFIEKYKPIQRQRLFGNVEFRDLTLEFCDKLENILKRRHRLGCKAIYKNIIKQSNIFKNLLVFPEFQQKLIEKENKKNLDWAMENFPKYAKQMRISDYFVTPSLVQKYMIIKQGSQPIPNLQFHEQKVYYKSDLQPVSSRMGWVDLGRMIKQGEIPVKTTENKNKTTTKLYKFSQTQPFQLKITSQGDFVLDQQYNSIYVPPQFDIPQGYVLIPQNVEYLCKIKKFKCARIVQGFDVAGMHIVPNNIGYLVEQKHKDQIQKIYKERQQKLRLKRQSKKIENAMGLWRKLFKSIIITQQVHNI